MGKAVDQRVVPLSFIHDAIRSWKHSAINYQKLGGVLKENFKDFVTSPVNLCVVPKKDKYFDISIGSFHGPLSLWVPRFSMYHFDLRPPADELFEYSVFKLFPIVGM